MKSEYRMFHGSYAYYVDDKLQFMAERIGIGYTLEEPPLLATFHKHGPVEKVRDWMEATRMAYLNAGYDDLASNLYVIESDVFEVEDLNKFLSITGYLGVWLRDHDVI